MTTRRSRLQIRPNIGRGTGNDIITKKTCIASKFAPKKDGKENAKIEDNNLTEPVFGEITDRISSKQPSDDKELTAKEHDITRDKNISNVQNSSSFSLNVEDIDKKSTATTASENYNRLLNRSRECTVVLDRNIITPRKNTEPVEKCSRNSSVEGSEIEDAAVELLCEKESYNERTASLDSQQNVHGSELGDRQPVNVSCNDTDKEKNTSKSEIIIEDDISENSTGIPQHASDNTVVKSVVLKSVISPERRPSNKANSSEEKSKRRNRLSKKPPERGTMTMMDLIFWNPPNNPMSQETKTEDKTNEADTSVLEAAEEEEEIDGGLDVKDGGVSAEDSSKTETEEVPGPRVMVGPNGDITIDEDSLVIRRTDPEKIASKKVVQEVEACTYNSFRKQKPKHYWSDRETAKFYKALSILGTDFSLMMSFFPTRSRQELKNKFKREERLNRHLVDRAIRDPRQFDLTAFDDDGDDNEGADDPDDVDFDINEELKKTCKRRKYTKRKGVKNKGSFEDGETNECDVALSSTIPHENIAGVRKSSRKRKETSKEITTYTSTTEKKRCKPRASKSKKKTEEIIVENEPLEVLEIPNENLEIVTEDQSVIICHSPSTSDAAVCEETVQRKEATDSNVEKDICKQNITIEKPDMQLRQLNVSVPIISNNLLQTNTNQANLAPGQLVLVPGKTDNANEQVVHVYIVSPPHYSQQSLLPAQQISEPADEVS